MMCLLQFLLENILKWEQFGTVSSDLCIENNAFDVWFVKYARIVEAK